MNVPCVRVPRESGEAARRRLADAGLLDHDHEITVAEGTLYIPVIDADAVPDDLAVVDFEPPTRETQTTPADLLGFEPSYERLGDIVILDEDDPDRARDIADAIVASDLKAETVVNRASKVKGELRIRDWDVLVGDSTETVHREYGHEFRLDIGAVYFSPRLATERHRVVEAVREGEHVFDMFAGVGPFAVPAAAAGAEVVACDLNEAAVEYLRENAERNDVTDRITAIHGDVREVAADYEGWADRLIMNLPHSASDFLDTAVRLASDECVIHLYDIQHEDDPFGPGLAAVRAAAEPTYEVEVVNEHVVRSYAPHEYNVCLDVRLTKRA
ncbi:SAM-dependent methyltransferase [Haloferax sp. Atlit-12N]|uniref:class I SAM-dependent methyltransferase n=1 Tax=Haloferax sp. Atlit-12N TaxID=2077203 RepID=UPI000E27691E|nr:class I SAM-dependent methyltransferase family protein [Haloferax sp. Atlit-12N]RDZ65321.1 SAM-dependent methyltransferase [Haloferax sp. Atlit-12N]